MTNSLKLTFKIYHPSLDLNDISKQINIVPDRIGKAGSLIPNHSGKIKDYKFRASFMSKDIELEDNESVSDAIVRFCESIGANSLLILDIVESGGEIEFLVGLFIDGNDVQVFDGRVITACHSINARISVCCYPEFGS